MRIHSSCPSCSCRKDLEDKDKVLQALRVTNWNRQKAATYLGIPKNRFYYIARKLGIDLKLEHRKVQIAEFLAGRR